MVHGHDHSVLEARAATPRGHLMAPSGRGCSLGVVSATIRKGAVCAREADAKTSVRAATVTMEVRTEVVFREWFIFVSLRYRIGLTVGRAVRDSESSGNPCQGPLAQWSNLTRTFGQIAATG